MDFFNVLNPEWIIAVYLRLSKEDGDITDDENKLESNSIQNQKTLILNYLEKIPNVKIYDFYADDGYTGTNFERPDFKRMRNDFMEGRVNMVIVKDLSRFGRDYIETGRYIKKIFPALGVRFVSILDHFDSEAANASDYNLLLPVKSFVNDQYSSDISNKVRSTQSVLRSMGKYIGSYVGYGRMKSPEDKHEIILDDYASGIILEMVKYLYSGESANGLSEWLNQRGVLAPSDYKQLLGINYKSGFRLKQKSEWSVKSVQRVLTDPMNYGAIVQGKRKRINYKVRIVVEKPEEEWDIKENAVPAIITKDTYDNVKRLLLMDVRKAPGQEKIYLFGGLLRCGDCNSSMIRRKVGGKGFYICSSYNVKKSCTRHAISEEDLKSIVLSLIRQYIYHLIQIEDILSYIETIDLTPEKVASCDEDIQRKYQELQRYSRLQVALCEHWASGVIDEEEFKEFKSIYEEESRKLEEQIAYLKGEIEQTAKNWEAGKNWIDQFRQYENVEELDRVMLVLLIDQIQIYEDKRVEIVFRFRDQYEAYLKYIKVTGIDIENGTNAEGELIPVSGTDPEERKEIADKTNPTAPSTAADKPPAASTEMEVA